MFKRSYLVLLAGLAACAPATSRIPPERLRISALDAQREARTVAVGWATGALLRYIEGEGVSPEGYVLPDRGAWRFFYDASGRADQLVVTVTPRTLDRVTRPATVPPGFDLGRAHLTEDWVDSPVVMAAVQASGGEAVLSAHEPAVSLLLLPLRPEQWVVRVAAGRESEEWRVDARTGKVR